MRKLVVEGSEYKVVHQELLCNLLLLSTSTYSQVASSSQKQLSSVTRCCFMHGYKVKKKKCENCHVLNVSVNVCFRSVAGLRTC